MAKYIGITPYVLPKSGFNHPYLRDTFNCLLKALPRNESFGNRYMYQYPAANRAGDYVNNALCLFTGNEDKLGADDVQRA